MGGRVGDNVDNVRCGGTQCWRGKAVIEEQPVDELEHK